jgi:hypothetical protein
MRIFLLITCLTATLSVHAVEFTFISRSQPVTLVHAAEFTAYVDISLKLNTEKATGKTLHLRLRYIIGNDTLHDNLTVKDGHSGVVKQLLMNEGERLTAQVILNNAEVDVIEGLEGSFRASTNGTVSVPSAMGQSEFLGHVWLREQNPLFRVKFEDAAPREVQLVFNLDENYEFDALHFKVKVISPEQGILFLTRSATVTEETQQQSRKRTLRLSLDGVNFSYPGSYYLQVMHTMVPDRVNGVEQVSYQVVTK